MCNGEGANLLRIDCANFQFSGRFLSIYRSGSDLFNYVAKRYNLYRLITAELLSVDVHTEMLHKVRNVDSSTIARMNDIL